MAKAPNFGGLDPLDVIGMINRIAIEVQDPLLNIEPKTKEEALLKGKRLHDKYYHRAIKRLLNGDKPIVYTDEEIIEVNEKVKGDK